MNRNLRVRRIVRAMRSDVSTPTDAREMLDVIDTFAPDRDVFTDLAVNENHSSAVRGVLNRVTFELSDEADDIEDLRELGPPVAIEPEKEPEWHALVADGKLQDPLARYDELRRR